MHRRSPGLLPSSCRRRSHRTRTLSRRRQARSLRLIGVRPRSPARCALQARTAEASGLAGSAWPLRRPSWTSSFQSGGSARAAGEGGRTWGRGQSVNGAARSWGEGEGMTLQPQTELDWLVLNRWSEAAIAGDMRKDLKHRGARVAGFDHGLQILAADQIPIPGADAEPAKRFELFVRQAARRRQTEKFPRQSR